MNKLLTVILLCGAMALGGGGVAHQPLDLTIHAEGINLPEGTVVEVDVSAEYRIVEPRVAVSERGKFVAVTDDMTTFRAPAAERHKWSFVATKNSQTTKSSSREDFAFTIPAGLPGSHSGSDAAIYVPVNYTVAIPGFPPVKERLTFPVRIEGKTMSRCLRLELMNGTQLRVGLLPTCNHTFEQLGAVPLATGD